jgi:hypothetical protein
VVYDPLDASDIIRHLTASVEGNEVVLPLSVLGVTIEHSLNDVDSVAAALNTKYGKLLKSVPVSSIVL